MVSVLAQLTLPEAGATAAGGAVVCLATLKLLRVLAARGVHARLDVGDATTNGKKGAVCAVHTVFGEKLDERHTMLSQMLTEIKTSVNNLHDKLDRHA